MSTFILYQSKVTCTETDTILSYWRCPVTISRNPKNDLDIFTSAPPSWICHCCIRLFQHFAIMYTGFAGLPHHFHSAGPSCDLLRAQTDGSPKELSLDCRGMGLYIQAKRFTFPPRCTVWGHALSFWRIICLFICLSQNTCRSFWSTWM
jgi:hypothetical protein